MMKGKLKILFYNLWFLLVISVSLNAQSALLDPDFVKAGKFDTGKMWTFDDPPVNYFTETYGFTPDENWLEHVRLSALRIPGCSASFISPNGLILTNHHCASGLKERVQKEGEDLENTGFYAASLEEERQVPKYWADQLVLIKDVTAEILEAFSMGTTEEEKVKNKDEKIDELEKSYSEETGLKCSVVSLYNGGKFSLYGYKRYTDVRLVFIPEPWIGEYGGDADNFTYPRYDLDCAILRVYDENGEPLKSDHYFEWSENGANPDDVIFTVGNPGTTRRLFTVAQLEYYRDITYKGITFRLNSFFKKLGDLQNQFPERFNKYERMKRRIGNMQKSYNGTYLGLMDPALMARKKDFEEKIKNSVNADPELKAKFGHVWEAVEKTRAEMREIGPAKSAYDALESRSMKSEYFNIASEIVRLSKEIVKPEEERGKKYKEDVIAETIKNIYPKQIDLELEKVKLEILLDFFAMTLGPDNKLVLDLTAGKTGAEAVEYLLSNTKLTNKEIVNNLVDNIEKIESCEDPIIKFVLYADVDSKKLGDRINEITNTEAVQINLLGQALYALYGTSIPPDANFTLRISDGLMKKYNYNGTEAPIFTTFYGLYDRYHSHQKTYPWDLPESWKNPPADFNMFTPFNFIATNDIVGGNSGSAVINRNAQVVGLAFDGNMESLNGNFIFLTETNRCVSVASQAIFQALDKIYKAERLVKEIKSGVLVK